MSETSELELLDEGVVPIPPDRTYRRQGRHIIIATMESLTPLHSTLDPRIWGPGTSVYTWGDVQRFYSREPLARNGQMPMHYYSEYLGDDYVAFVGCPLTNTSWFLQEAVRRGVLHVQYLDAILVVLQENFAIEVPERRLWRMLSHQILTPLMRMMEIGRPNVVFFERIANREAADGPDWPFRFREATFLDPVILDLFLKDYGKR